jgi:hypothetical protein
MRILLKIEEFGLFSLSMFLFAQLDFSWWWYILLFFAPDASMVGYAWGPGTGAIVYNFVHHKALAVGLYILGSLIGMQVLELAGLILLGHSSLDRVLGYGLKYPDSFHTTHLGLIGKPRDA